jgi:ABC-type glycerol-3-phosphate transport system substrate-binding protein
MVLSAKSDCLEGAWEFVRYYLTDEYQGSLGWGLPVSKKYFDQQAEQGTKRPTYTDYETGEEVEYDEAFWMNGEEIVLDPLTEEQMNKVVAFVESVDTPYYSDDDVLNIINEELGSFYTGQKSAKDTAAIIQNRVQLYVEENR